MSPVFLVSVIVFVMSPALDTAHDGVAFSFSKYFQIPDQIVQEWRFSSLIPPCIHSWEGSLSTLLPLPPFDALVVVVPCQFFSPFFSVVAWLEVK